MADQILKSTTLTSAAHQTLISHRFKLGLQTTLILGLMLALAGLFIFSLTFGSVEIPSRTVITILLGNGDEVRTAYTTIVMKYRFPKAVTAMLAGAALAVSGLQMQTMFRNPLAGPFVLGISSGASLGVALLVLSSGAGVIGGALLPSRALTSDTNLILAAIIGAGVVMTLVLFVAQAVPNSTTLLIVGLMFGYLTSAIVSLLMYFSIAEQIQAYVNWTFGSFSGVTRSQLNIFAPVILVSLVSSLLLSKPLNALLLGETYARSMGLRIQIARFCIVLSTAILAGTVTAFCGPIAFLGIAVPHLTRMTFNTADHRILMPACMLMGAIVALIAAIIADLPGTSLVLPLNAVTSLIGAPVVIIVILKRQNLHKSFG
ncbi:MAG: iron ABC transporter [Phototrophicales bacterium]|nr:MAG: iron ABC transporter [Phototrophicales bacterium]